MLKQTILISFFLIPLQLFSQTSENDQYKNITNELTDEHVFIPGSKLALIPPEGFEISKTLKGFQKGENYGIQVFDLEGGNFYSNTKTFSKAAFEKKGLEVLDYYESTINNYPFKFAHVQGDQSIKTLNITFGDSTFSVMILGVYPSFDEAEGEKIQEAIFSAFYEKTKDIDPLLYTHFNLDDSKSKLKFFTASANMFLYTIGGVDSSPDSDDPVLMVLPLPKTPLMTPESLAEIMVTGFEKKGFEISKKEILSKEKINGYDACQLFVNGILQENEVGLFVQSIIKDDKAFIIQGISKKSGDEDLKAFKELSETIKIKE